MSSETSGMAGRLRQVEESTRAALQQRERMVSQGAIELYPESTRLPVPVPRRGRMFIRHGEGHGAFSDVTLTSPTRAGEVAPA